jgi:hypothetical protein
LVILVLGNSALCAAQNAIVVFGIDETGSYNLRSKGIAIGQSIVNGLKSGDVMYARRITDKSYSDACSVFRLTVPETGEQPANKFNRTAFITWQEKNKKAGIVKSRASHILANLTTLKAPRTDIWGFLSAAAVRFNAERCEDCARTVIIASDMKDNMNRKVPPFDLKGAEIIIVGFEAGIDPDDAHQIQEKWINILKKYNAGNVYFMPADARLDFRRHYANKKAAGGK